MFFTNGEALRTMEIIRHAIISHEPLVLHLILAREPTPEELRRLDALLERWLARQLPQRSEVQLYKPTIERRGEPDRCQIKFTAEWFPIEWCEPLAEIIQEQMPSAVRLEIGTDFVPVFRDDHAFICVGQKRLQLGDGTTEDVGSFEIAKFPVSIAQFARFADATGYRTTAERRDDEYWFRNPPSLQGVPDNKRGPVTAYFVSYNDAVAYCEWANARLPTELEWLSAAIVVEDEIEETDALDRFKELYDLPNALMEVGEEITGSFAGDQVVVRRGPLLFRVRGRGDARDRLLVRKSYYEDLQFRVCRRSVRS
jgi:hypothetical protein